MLLLCLMYLLTCRYSRSELRQNQHV